ncbi:MAG: ParA family protein [Chloroflexales bacterium]
MARIIAVAVPKGGAGKTSTTLNLGAALAARGQRVLLIDFDPQGNLSLSLRAVPGAPSLYSTIKEFIATWEPHMERVIQPSSIPNIDIVPTDVWLNEADEELRGADRREYVLQKLVEPVAHAYDFVLIDTLPYFGMLVKNALVAADELIIPMQAEFLATQSIEMMLKLVERIQRSGLNPLLRVLGVLVTQVDMRTNMGRQAEGYARTEFLGRVPIFTTTVKRTVRMAESQAMGQSLAQYDPDGEAAAAYRALAEEVLHAA